MGYYDIAQICLNGHVVNDRSRGSPEFNAPYCRKCGAETIVACPSCSKDIRGDYVVPNVLVLGGSPSPAPAYCHNCGKPFPWTQRRLDALTSLTGESSSLADDRDDLADLVPDLMADTPRTELAVARWRKALAKVEEHIAPALKSILTQIASEAVKKMLFPGV
jgi:hypothetical protein